MNIVENLRSRWAPEWTGRTDLVRLHAAFNEAVHYIEAVPEYRADLAKPGDLSAKGLNQAMRNKAAEKIVPALRRASWEAEKAANAIKAERRKLAVPASDKSDLAGALLRQEVRSFLRAANQGDRIKLIMSDPVFLQAAMEGPAALSGLTDELRADLESRMIDRAHGAAVDAMESVMEAVNVTQAAVEVASSTLQQECGFDGNTGAFNEWMAQASAGVEREIAAEKAKSEPANSAAESLTAPVRADVQAEVDAIFAKALPHIYPDHPVNKAA